MVNPEGPVEVVDALAHALARAGYTVVTRATPDELEVRVVARAQPLASAGREVAYGVAVDLVDRRERVDALRTSFVAEPQSVNAETMRPLLVAIVEHGRVLVLLAQRARAREEREAAERAKEEAAWKSAQADQCSALATDDACEPLTRWLSANFESARARIANEILGAVARRRAEDRERRLWAGAGRARCATPRVAADCDALRHHLESFPDGPHAVEARATLERSTSAIERLRRRELHPTPAQHRADCAAFCDEKEARSENCDHLTGRAQIACARDECFRTCVLGPPGE
jgi:hypothetical protein